MLPIRRRRWIPLALLLIVIVSLLPLQSTSAIPMLPQSDALTKRVPEILDEPPVNNRPSPAQSAVTPKEEAQNIAPVAESQHSFSGIDLTFTGDTISQVPVAATNAAVYVAQATVNDLYIVNGQPHYNSDNLSYYEDTGIFMNLPRDSFTVNVEVAVGNIGFIYIQSVNNPQIYQKAAFTTPQGNPHDMHFTIGPSIPRNQPIHIYVGCFNPQPGGYNNCRYTNFQFYLDSDVLTRIPDPAYDHPKKLLPSYINQVNTGKYLPADGAGNPFFMYGYLPPVQGIDEKFLYQTKAFNFPALQPNDTITINFRYSAFSWPGTTPANSFGSHINLFFSDANSSTYDVFGWDTLSRDLTNPINIPIPGFSTYSYIPWRSGSITLNQNIYSQISNKTIRINLAPQSADSQYYPYLAGIDSIQFYRNGKLMNFSSIEDRIPADQNGGSCAPCTAAGESTMIVGDPVNTLSGAYIEHGVDQQIPTGGTALSLQRTYVSTLANSSLYPQSSLGLGWRFNYAESLTLPVEITGVTTVGAESNTVIYEAADGNRYRFKRHGNDFVAARGIRLTLTKNATSYTLQAADQSAKTFDLQGRLLQLRDVYGRTQTITLGTSGIQTGLPVEVRDDLSQRKLRLEYTTTSGVVRLYRLLNDLNQATVYEYTQGRLEWVTSPQSILSRYTYDPTSLLMSSVTRNATSKSPLPTADLVMSYTNGRVTQQTAPADNTVWAYTYTGTGANQAQTTTMTVSRGGIVLDVQRSHYRADGTFAWQERNDALLEYVANDRMLAPTAGVKADKSIALHHNNPKGQPVEVYAGAIEGAILGTTQRTFAISYTPTGYPAIVTNTNGLETYTTYNSANQPLTTKAGTGTLVPTQTWTYDAATKQPQTITSPDGIVTRYTYTAAGQVASTEVGYGTSSVQKTTYQYDSLGRQTHMTLGDGLPNATTTVTEYRPDNQIAKITRNYVAGNTTDPRKNVVTEYGYNAKGQLIWTKTPDGRYRGVTSYDALGRVRWVADNTVNPSTGAIAIADTSSTSLPPSFSPQRPDANIVTMYGYDWHGRTTLITQTGIVTGTFNVATLQWQSSTSRVTRIEYDQLSRPVTTTYNYRPDIYAGQFNTNHPDVNVPTYTYYDGAGKVTWTRDGLRRWNHFEYDQLGRPVTTTLNYENGDPLTVDPVNATWASTNDTDIISITHYDQGGQIDHTIRNFVDGVRDTTIPDSSIPWQITDVVTDVVTRYHYDQAGRMDQTISNYVAGATDPEFNRVANTIYDQATGRTLGVTDAWNQYTVYEYDQLGRSVSSVTNCRTSSGVPTYNRNTCASTTSQRNLPSPLSVYDQLGRLSQTLSVDAIGGLGFNGPPTQYSYDGLGQLVETIVNSQPGQAASATVNVKSTTTYLDAAGSRWNETDPTGKITQYETDGFGQVNKVIDPAGLITLSGPRWTKTPDGQVRVAMIDGLGRTIKTVSNYQDGVYVPATDTTTHDIITLTRYDVGGRQVAVTNSLNIRTRYDYDLRDNLIRIIENDLGTCTASDTNDCQVTTEYRYDRVGNLIKTIDARGYSTTKSYDSLGRVRRTTDGLNRHTLLTYNQDDTVATIAPATGNPISYSYDEVGHQIQATGWDSTAVQQWTYDLAGRLSSVYDASAQDAAAGRTGTISYKYDVLNRISSVAQSLEGDPQGNWTLTYGYDAAGRTTAIGGTSYSYDTAGRLSSVIRGGSPLAQYAYQGSTGRVASITRLEAGNNRLIESLGYDTRGRVTSRSITGATTAAAMPTPTAPQLAQFTYAYDRADQPTSFTETQLNSAGTATTNETHSYTYDKLNRLISENASGTTTTFRFDAAGNRIKVNSQNSSYNAANERVGFAYDVYGNVTGDGQNVFSYDGFNRLKSVIKGANVYSYRYHEETLTSRFVNGTRTQAFNYDRVGTSLSSILRIHTIQPTDTLYTTYITGLGGDIIQSEATFNGAPQTNGKLFLISDNQSTVRMLVNASNGARTKQDSDAWGNFVPAAGQTLAPSSIRYTGEYTDRDTGLVFLRARWYNPASGTLLSKDPFAGFANQPQSQHPYIYAGNNPTTNSDPTGRTCEGCQPAGVTRDQWHQYVDLYDVTYSGFVGALINHPFDRMGDATVFDNYAHATRSSLDFIYYLKNFLWGCSIQQYGALENLWSNAETWSEHFYHDRLPSVPLHRYDSIEDAMDALGDEAYLNYFIETNLADGNHLDPIDSISPGLADVPVVPSTPRQNNPSTDVDDPAPAKSPKPSNDPDVDVDNPAPSISPKVGESCSFDATTLVATDEGLVPIATIQVGDLVLAYDEATGTTDYYTVTASFVHSDPVLVDVAIDNEWINTTPEHPFFTADGWTDAENLELSDWVASADGEWGKSPRCAYVATNALCTTLRLPKLIPSLLVMVAG